MTMFSNALYGLAAGVGLAGLALTAPSLAVADERKPNILVLMGDDIGYWNISAYGKLLNVAGSSN